MRLEKGASPLNNFAGRTGIKQQKGYMLITVGIYRPLWLRGEENSYLQRTRDGKRCCLGTAALRLGATEAQIMGEFSPSSLQRNTKFTMPGLLTTDGESNTEASNLMGTNDCFGARHSGPFWNEINTDADRERVLKREAVKAGYRFVFTDSKWLADLINKVDPYLHRLAAWWGCQTYGCAYVKRTA